MATETTENCPVCGKPLVVEDVVGRRIVWRPDWSDHGYCSQECARTERMAYALMTVGAGVDTTQEMEIVHEPTKFTPDVVDRLYKGPDPTICPECGEPKQAEYDVCYNCKFKNAHPCKRCGKPVANPKYEFCYNCGSAANKRPAADDRGNW